MINTEHHSEKKILRKFLIDRRKHLSREYEEKNLSHVHLRPLLNNMNSDYVGSYINYNSEISTKALNKYLIEKNFNICLPKIDYQTNEINFFKYRAGTKLIKNKYNILEPEITNEIIFPKLVLVPLLAFNTSGFRLGYGGGFYDKYFSFQEEKEIIKVGLGFSFQKVYEIPIEVHDQKLDWILTENYLYKVI